MKLVLATHNAHKVAELRRILDGLDVELLSADDVELPDVEETGVTFAENALLKARSAVEVTGIAAVADDSGLEVDALDGEPGVRSARYAGAHGDDRANLALVLERLIEVTGPAGRGSLGTGPADVGGADVGGAGTSPMGTGEAARRGGRFVCAAALVTPDGREEVVHGVLDGWITDRPRGDGGFGYDPVFVPHGSDRTTAEMTPQEKDAISHRGKAFRGLRDVLAPHVGG